MNFLHRNRNQYGSCSYKFVENNYDLPTYSKIETTIYNKKIHSWKKATLGNDWLTIKIGCDNIITKKKIKHENNRIKSTKYSLITFLPLNLLEQFRRVANFYFLLITIIGALIQGPVSPMTSLLPLAFVISVTAAKQGYEDYLRYKTDNIVNCSPVTVIRNGEEQNIECQHVRQGDLVVVTRDCDVPCDLVLLQSSDPTGKCFITTANLDGESNLKTLIIPRNLPKTDSSKLHTLGNIECELPKFDLYSFNGKVLLYANNPHINTEINEIMLPLSSENLLLRGSRVKNTETVIGCAVYTGMSTKLALNSRLTRNKNASSESYINKYLIFVLITLIIIVTFNYFLKRYYEMFIIENHKYLGPPIDTTLIKSFLQDFLSFLILFNYLIPISLYVTIELNRVLGGFFMEWDLALYDEQTDQPCIVNTSNLNEELGQINILFSDKTGTLTKNEMVFQQCSINSKKYTYNGTKLQLENSTSLLDISKFQDYEMEFFKALSICHTIQVAGCSAEQETYAVPETVPLYTEVLDERNNSDFGSSISINSKLLNSQQSNSGSNNSYNIKEDQIDCILRPKIYPDVNPLLTKLTLEEKRNRIVKRSPRFARSTKIHPIDGIAHSDSNLIDSPTRSAAIMNSAYTKYQQNLIATNLKSLPFNRSTSHIDLPVTEKLYMGNNLLKTHRRTQSYGANPNDNTHNQSNTMPNLVRSGSQVSQRESYALPNYIPQLKSSIVRANSHLRKKEIHNVVEKLDYQASSPDEKALIEACANLGFLYLGDDNDILNIQICPPQIDYSKPFALNNCKIVHFKRLHILEFNSDRKRMSVIVADERKHVWIYTKGAESFIFPLCSEECKDMINKTNKHITDFSRLGLRTLAVARRKLTALEYSEFLQDMAIANSSLHSRQRLFDKCYEKVERNLELLGATAVEDALQDEVSQTLVALQKAGIKIWVLTGDKIETALNIAISCGHIPANALQYFITECTQKADLEQHLEVLTNEMVENSNRPATLLIDGKSLTVALKEVKEKFRDTAIKCVAVLCCRLSPLQKCEVVQLIKTSKENYITASIGDGANDVSMIQEAHIGFGIVGLEGRQAARCADFSFANFKMLRRLILVHGHYHSTRMALLVLYFFYKNFLFMTIQAIMQFHMMFSTASAYDSLFLTLYNVVYTSVPILFISLSEKPYTEETLNEKPELYKNNINNKGLHWNKFVIWIFLALFHAIVIFYFTYYLFSINNNILSIKGNTADFACLTILLIQNVVIIVNLKLWLETTYQSYIYIATIVGSILAFVVTTFVYNVIPIRYDTYIYFAYNNLVASPTFYILSILITIAALLPDYTIRVAKLGLNIPKGANVLSGSIYPRNSGSTIINLRNNNVQSTYL